MTFKTKTIDEWCEKKFSDYEISKELEKNKPLVVQGDPPPNLVVKPTRFERKCLVGKDETPCYFHGWFQLNTPTKDGNSIAYPVGIVEHRDDGVIEQVKVTSIKFVEAFE